MTQRRPSRPPARPLLRLLMVAVPVLVLLGGAVSEASAARIKGPKRVKPGKVITLRVSGLRSGQEFSIRIQPSTTPKDRLGLDGALIQSDIRGKGLQGNSSGRAVVRIRFPKRRLQCGASCGGHAPWKKGSWVDIDIPANSGGRLARTRAQIRGGKRSTHRRRLSADPGAAFGATEGRRRILREYAS